MKKLIARLLRRHEPAMQRETLADWMAGMLMSHRASLGVESVLGPRHNVGPLGGESQQITLLMSTGTLVSINVYGRGEV